GNVASGATIPVSDTRGANALGACTIADAVNSINAGSLIGACTLTGTDDFGVNDTVDLTGFTAPATITFPDIPFAPAPLNVYRPTVIRGSLDSHGRPLVTLTRNRE